MDQSEIILLPVTLSYPTTKYTIEFSNVLENAVMRRSPRAGTSRNPTRKRDLPSWYLSCAPGIGCKRKDSHSRIAFIDSRQSSFASHGISPSRDERPILVMFRLTRRSARRVKAWEAWEIWEAWGLTSCRSFSPQSLDKAVQAYLLPKLLNSCDAYPC